MPNISSTRTKTKVTSVTQNTPSKPGSAQLKKNTTVANKGWVTGTSKVASKASATTVKLPGISKEVKGFVDASLKAGKAITQMDMNAGAFKVDAAASKMLHAVANELVSQYEERGLTKQANALRENLAKFDTKLSKETPDPQGGTIAPLEMAMEHSSKRLNYMNELANQLSKLTKTPSGEYQAAYNSNARAGSVVAGARFAIAYDKKSSDGNSERITNDLKGFFSGLQARIDKQVDSKGGSLEPMERAGLLATELNAMTKKMLLHVPEL